MKKSESISELSKAIVLFQSKLIKVKKDSENPFFKNKYASLSNIIEATQKVLSECGLAVIQMPTGISNLETILMHESGEWISETYEMRPTKNDPQGLGSAITYQRRYAMGAILCLNIDEDDDAEGRRDMTDERFKNMMKELSKATNDQSEKWIKIARRDYIFTDEQEMKLSDFEDNLN